MPIQATNRGLLSPTHLSLIIHHNLQAHNHIGLQISVRHHLSLLSTVCQQVPQNHSLHPRGLHHPTLSPQRPRFANEIWSRPCTQHPCPLHLEGCRIRRLTPPFRCLLILLAATPLISSQSHTPPRLIGILQPGNSPVFLSNPDHLCHLWMRVLLLLQHLLADSLLIQRVSRWML